MPPLRTYNDGKHIYSVDMMLAYVNTHNHSIVKITIDELLPQLKQPVWGEWSPMTVIEKMDVKKYQDNSNRIREADLSYPIILTDRSPKLAYPVPEHIIVDGYHRIAKAYLDGKKEIKAYIFDSSLMKKFILDKNLNFVKVHNKLSISDILELWSKNF